MNIITGIFSESFWWVAPIIVTLTTAITGLINQGFGIKADWTKRLMSWFIASALSVGAWVLNLVGFSEPIWLGIVALCVTTGLAANGFYSINEIKNFISTWFNKQI